MDKSLIGLAGEYHVLAQLAQRDLVGALTLGHTKGVDIVVTNPRSGALRKVEVKTTRAALCRAPLFGSGRFFAWTLSAKHELVSDPNLVYCFVALSGPDTRPRFFLVPSDEVAKYVRWEHQYWLRKRHGKDNQVRQFRIEESDPKGYAENWAVFD